MKILVLGGGGFIGSSVVQALSQKGHQVAVFENPRVEPSPYISGMPGVTWVQGNFLDKQDIHAALDGVDSVIHLISTTLPKTSNDNPVFDIESNLIGTLNLLHMMKERGVSSIVFSSSGGTVYGIPEHIPVSETHATNPIVSYGIVKLAIEKYLHLYKTMHGLKPVILRVSNPYGPRQNSGTAQGVIRAIIDSKLQNKPVEIWGDGSVVRDYLYISDVGSAFERATAYTGSDSVFNVSSGQGVSLNELLKIVGDVMGSPVECKYMEGRAYDVPVSILDNTKAESVLGWKPEVPLREGIEKTIEWIRANGR